MTRSFFLALPIVIAMPFSAMAQTQSETVTPTIPETQIEPAALSSPYEFVSAATSADVFIVEASALAEAKPAASAEVKALAAGLSATHAKLLEATRDAGKSDGAEIAEPSVDGEQQGMLGKLEGFDAAEFDKSYVEAMTYVHQRLISYYRGFAEKGGSLGSFAAANLPTLVADYTKLTGITGTVGASGAQQPAAAQ